MKLDEFNKLSKEEQAKVALKDKPTSVKVVLGIMVLLVALALFWIFKPGAPEIPFSEMTAAQKTEWLNDYKNGSDAFDMNMHLEKVIASQFNFPETVEVEDRFKLCERAKVLDANAGHCVVSGEAVANNAFNVPIRHSFMAWFTLTPERNYVDSVKIFQ